MTKGTDRTFDLALALAASIAANGIVAVATTANAAAKYAKPAGRLAGKVGHRLLGGSPFNEREAQRFLTMGGSERLAEFEAEREVLEPGELNDGKTPINPEWQMSGPGKFTIETLPHDYAVKVSPARCRKHADFTPNCSDIGAVNDEYFACTTCNPAGAAASEASIGGVQDAPGVQPPVEQAPGPAQTSPSCAGLGVTSMPKALRQLDDLLRGLTIEPRSEHPMYAQIQDVTDAAVVADVLAEHQYGTWGLPNKCCCSEDDVFPTREDWRAHVAPLIIQALQQ